MNILITYAFVALTTAILVVLLVRTSLACRKLKDENAALRQTHASSVTELRPASSVLPGVIVESGTVDGGIDLTAGLRMTGGKQKLFLKFLGDFREKYRDFPGQAQNLLAAGKPGDLERLAHTLKGNAGMLGFREVSVASAALESRAREAIQIDPADLSGQTVRTIQADPAELTAALHRVVQSLGPAFLSIRLALEDQTGDSPAPLPAAPEAGNPIKSPENLQILLSRALDFLDRGEYGAQAILASIEQTWDVSACRNAFDRICAAVDNGDYDEACQDLGELIASRKIT